VETNVARAFEAVRSGDSATLSALLREDPRLARARNAEGVSIVLWARYLGQTALLGPLLSAGEPLDIFEASAFEGGAERVATLLRSAPELASAYSSDGFTPLHLAAYFGQDGAAHSLLQAGADPNAVSQNPMALRPLHSAAVSRSLAIVAALLEGGADPNVKQHGGWTPLHASAFNGDRAMTELLVARGAKPDALSDDGKTPRDIAVEKGHDTVTAWLRAHEAPAAAG
jgi:ankyrin repeat protein